jgi:hypothetical protein
LVNKIHYFAKVTIGVVILAAAILLSWENTTSASKPDPVPTIYHLEPAGGTMSVLSSDPPDPRYSHQSAVIATDDGQAQASLVFIDDPTWFQIFVLAPATPEEPAVEIDIVFQVDGVSDSRSFTGTLDDAGVYSLTNELSTNALPNGIDVYDADGDGEFLDLDAYPNSDDHPLLAFQQVVITNPSGTNWVWSNPDIP